MSLPLLCPVDYAAYLALEREIDRRYEYLDGEAWERGGGSSTPSRSRRCGTTCS